MEEKFELKKDLLKRARIFSKENEINCRILANFVDILIVSPISWLILAPIVSLALQLRYLEFLDGRFHGFFTMFLMFFVFMIYSAFLESSRYRATIGQTFFRIKVSGRKGKRISFIKGIKRGFLKLLASPVLFIYIPLFILMEFFIMPLKENMVEVIFEKRR